MKCKKVKKKLLTFLDRELPEKQRIKIQNHLDGCPDCLRQVEFLSKIWDVTEKFERIEPSPYLWNRLSQIIAEYKNNRNPYSVFFEKIGRYAVPITATVIFLMGIFAGIYLGNFPDSLKSNTSSLNSDITDKEKFIRSSYLDSFDVLPPESIGGILITLASEKE